MKWKLLGGLSMLVILLSICTHTSFSANANNANTKTVPMTSTVLEPVAKDVTFGELIKAGGWTMIVLILLSVVAFALIFYNFTTIKMDSLAPQPFAESLIYRLETGDSESARVMCQGKSNVIAIIARAGFDRGSKGRLIVREAMEHSARREVGKLWQNISYLGDIATIAPLLGLLGTTIGMIQAFNVISYAGTSLKPIMLVGGISKALVTTAAGLLVAVPALSFYSYFRGKVQAISDQIEAYSTDVMPLIEAQANQKIR